MFFDEKLWKELGYLIVGIWMLFGLVIAIFLSELQIHWILIVFIAGSWELVDAFILCVILHYFNIEKPEKVSKSKIVQMEPT